MDLYKLSRKQKIELAKTTTDSKILDLLSLETDWDIKAEVAENENSPLSALLRVFLVCSYIVLKNPSYINCYLKKLYSYADHGNESFRMGVAEHPKCHPDILDSLKEDPIKFVRRGVARNTNSYPQTLNYLSTDPDKDVRRSVVYNSKTPLPALLNLFLKFKQIVKNNPNYLNCVMSELTSYVTSDNESCRAGVAAHPKCPADILDYMSEDPSNYVREQVSKNKNTPLSALLNLFLIFSENIKSNPAYINCDINELLSYVDHENDSFKACVAGHPKCTSPVLEQLSDAENEFVRAEVASNKNSPRHVLEKLSIDYEDLVKVSVARNQNCPPDILRKPLSKSYSILIKEAVAGNKNCPPDVLESLSNDTSTDVVKAVAENENCYPHTLKDLSTNEYPTVREAVAGNPKCPDPALINLCDDPNKEVRDAVLDNPRSFDIPQIVSKLKATGKKTVDEYSETKIPKNLNAPSHLHKSINTDLELLLALHKYLMREN